MVTFNSTPRGLTFPFDRGVSPTSTIPTDLQFTDINNWYVADSDQRVTITLDVSLNEFVAISSAIDAGSDIAFSDQAVMLWALWVSGANTMPLCDQIAECIANNPTVQEALTAYLGNENVPISTSESRIGTGDGNILAGLSCDDDDVWGYAVAIVDYLDAVNRDILERVENAPSLSASVARLADYIPLIGDLPFVDDLSDLVEWIQGEGLSSYEAGLTEPLKDDLYCGLWRIMCPSCQIFAEDIVRYFATLGGVTIQPNAIWRTIASLFTNLTGNTPFVYGMFALSSSVVAVGGEIAGITGFRGLGTIASTGTPSNAHATLCGACPQPPSCDLPILINFDGSVVPECASIVDGSLDATFGDPAPSVHNPRGTGTGRKIASVDIDLPSVASGTVTVSFDGFAYSGNGNNDRFVRWYDSNGNEIISSSAVKDTNNDQWLNVSFTETLSGLASVRIASGVFRSSVNPQEGEGAIDNISINVV